MQKSKIEWTDKTWNPVTGCLHDCPYCYARGIARRFGDKTAEDGICHFVGVPYRKGVNCDGDIIPYPYGFDPTFHRYKLEAPKKVKKPSTVFVGSMCDLFGSWIPDSWIQEVFAACVAAPQHKYIFLSISTFFSAKIPADIITLIKSRRAYIKTLRAYRRTASGKCLVICGSEQRRQRFKTRIVFLSN